MANFYAAVRADPDLARRFKESEADRKRLERLHRMCKEVTLLVHARNHGRLTGEGLKAALEALQAEAGRMGYRLKTYRPPPPSNATLAMFHRLVAYPEDVEEAERAREEAEAMNIFEYEETTNA
jgi:alkylated DNA repair dioxygenase AlkB